MAETEINQTVFYTRLGRAIQNQTDVWFGPVDVANALARALRDDKPITLMIRWDAASGLRITPDLLPEWATALNHVAGLDGGQGAVSAMIVKKALSATMRALFGYGGGVVTAQGSPSGELRVTITRQAIERKAA